MPFVLALTAEVKYRDHLSDDRRRLAVAEAMLDLFIRQLVDWSTKPRMTQQLIVDALRLA